jgi:hypothetical protein
MRISILLIFLFLVSSCSVSNTCNGIEEIYVPDILQKQASRAGFPYCSVLLDAKNKKPDALRKLIRFAYKTEDSSAIDHGIVFSELLLILGDDYAYQLLAREEEEMQLLAAKMMDACMEYRYPALPIKAELPKTFELLLGQYGLGED